VGFGLIMGSGFEIMDMVRNGDDYRVKGMAKR